MKHIAVAVQTIEELEKFLEENKMHAASAQSVLAQVFVAAQDPVWIRRVCDTIKGFSERVVIAGTTTAGEICAGRALNNATVVSLSFFEASTLVPIAFPAKGGQEIEAGKKLIEEIRKISTPVKGLLLFAPALSLNCSVLLKTIYDHSPGLPLFGGAAADYGKMAHSFIFSGDEIFEAGVVAVALFGPALHVWRDIFLGWRSIGKTMTVTKAKGLFLQEIDGRPAFEVYHQYLGIKADKNFFFNSLEFPILLKRGERILAATAIYVRPDGSIMTGTPMQEGETFQFGYGDITMILDEIPRLQRKIEQFAPEAIYVYSCLTRRFLLQEDVELELRPFEEIAPSAGFFTNGEFCDLGDQSSYMNTTIVLAALREGDAQQHQVSDEKHEKPLEIKDPFQRRHSRILSSFRYFLEAVTNELVQANDELKKKLDEIKRLRGILPICASCKKIRDDKGYWNQLETYIRDHSEADFSHGICPDCAKRLYPDFQKND